MAKIERFYRCSLRDLVACYYDCQSWLPVLDDAYRDEKSHTGRQILVYGLDNCDLVPFLAKEVSDEIYRLSRHDMVDKLIAAKWAAPKIVVPPATFIEYVRGALRRADKLKEYLKDFDSLKKSKGEGLQQLMWSEYVWTTYEKMRRLVESGPGVGGLSALRDALNEGKLITLEKAIGSRKLLTEVIQSDIRSDPKAMELLSKRRVDANAEFANLVDIANCDTFLAVDSVMRGEGYTFQMTTTGNLTLEACKRGCPNIPQERKPFRHLATPYIRTMLRQEEPGGPARLRRIRMGELALHEFIEEAGKVPELQQVTRAQVDNLDPNKKVGVSKRLYDALRAWLDLFYFPYLKGLKETETPIQHPKGKDIGFAVNWVAIHREDIEDRTKIPDKMISKELAEVGGFDADDVVERFVPHHPDADRILRWLRS